MRLTAGRAVPVRLLTDIAGRGIDLAAGDGLTHLQFRRFAGCPVCNLHLRSFVLRRAEVQAAMREVVVFHSSREDLLRYEGDLPFSIVADPDKALYRAFGVEAAARALLDPRAWPTIVRAVLSALPGVVLGRRPMPPLRPPGGRFGLPADFLVGPYGTVLAAKYGERADDHWSVDDALAAAAAQRDISVAAGMDWSSVRVAPPKKNSFSQDWL